MQETRKLEKLAVVEDDPVVQEILAEEIKNTLGVQSIHVFTNGQVAFTELAKDPVEVALFDINLPGMNGIECIQKLKLLHPRMQIIVLTVYDNTDVIFDALKAGATGYLLKSTPVEKVVEAIREVLSGGSPISAQIARKVIKAFQTKSLTNEYFQELSRREREILEQLNHGYRYKEIAEKLFLSVDTVRTHVRNIYEKLQVNSRAEALKKTGFL